MALVFAEGGIISEVAAGITAVTSFILAIIAWREHRQKVRAEEERRRAEEEKRRAEEEKQEAERRRLEAESDTKVAQENAQEQAIRNSELEIELETMGGRVKPPPVDDFYHTFGAGETRSWDEARRYSFICAGGGKTYSRPLRLLQPGCRVWVLVPGKGYVGVARVKGRPQPASEFRIKTQQGDVPVLDIAREANYHRQFVDDPENCEYFVPVEWLQTVPLDAGVWETGMFAIANTAAKPTAAKWCSTLEKLKSKFPYFSK